MHKVAPAIEAAIDIPLLHVADATARAVRAAGIARVGLLGTRFTMEQDFYVDRLASHGLEVLVPPPADRDEIHRVIYAELCQGRFEDASRRVFRRVMADLIARGVGGIILGCTEIGLLVDAGDAAVPQFDTTRLHALAAVEAALAD
jgi:aspartate racemase